MRLSPDAAAAIWLRDFVPDAENFDWDEGNRGKNAKHKVSDEEIETIFIQTVFVFAGRIAEPLHEEWRGLLLSVSARGKYLALIFTKRGEKLRPISCRPMRDGERRFYEASLEEES